MAHGQILLNQFQHFPNSAVKSSAFASSLKAAMEMRRHSKLYLRTAKPTTGRIMNRNPMKVSAPPSFCAMALGRAELQ